MEGMEWAIYGYDHKEIDSLHLGLILQPPYLLWMEKS